MSEKSKVYFADFRCPSWRENLPQKLARLMETAGFGVFHNDELLALLRRLAERQGLNKVSDFTGAVVPW